jgi:glyoxylase-like metal-dependent hydrolase (beta-lactamase superfamily II)
VLGLRAIDDRMFPANTRPALAAFWVRYWLWFFLLLPWMLFRQLFISLHQALGALWTWNRQVDLCDGALSLVFMTTLPSIAVTLIFGERFTAIRYADCLIDPGPLLGRRRLERYLRADGRRIGAIVATHAHEEHIGNTGLAARLTGAPVYGTRVTLAALRDPEVLSAPRRAFIGQPRREVGCAMRLLGDRVATAALRLEVIESPGHCDGHASLFDAERGILFAGDSFLHTVFTSPNKDVSGADWIATLERYGRWDVKTMVGTHGYVYSRDPAVARVAFVTKRGDPNRMIRDKLEFLRWARDVVAAGERRGLPYSVIEAALFPWQRWWSWHNWFSDESGRLFSAGEFSRTYFVRSLSQTPERVPPRFPPFARFADWAASLVRRAPP